MKFDTQANGNIIFYREKGDNFNDESQLMHNMKVLLNKWGYDLIKKKMYKDGHMTDNNRDYLRDRKWKFCLLDNEYYARDLLADFRKNGNVMLHYVKLEKPTKKLETTNGNQTV